MVDDFKLLIEHTDRAGWLDFINYRRGENITCSNDAQLVVWECVVDEDWTIHKNNTEKHYTFHCIEYGQKIQRKYNDATEWCGTIQLTISVDFDDGFMKVSGYSDVDIYVGLGETEQEVLYDLPFPCSEEAFFQKTLVNDLPLSYEQLSKIENLFRCVHKELGKCE